MKIVVDYPPNLETIDRAFDIRGKPILFAFGDTIYNPTNAGVSRQLLVHESVHGVRQGGDPLGWWERYIEEPSFRLAEEIPAHRAEYQAYCQLGNNRKNRRMYFNVVASRLSSPLYGKLISFQGAAAMLKRLPKPEAEGANDSTDPRG